MNWNADENTTLPLLFMDTGTETPTVNWKMEGRWSEFNGGRHETTSLSRGREKIGGEGGKGGGMVEQVVEEVLEGISL